MSTELRILFTSVGRRVELMQAFRAAADRLGQPLVLYGADIANTAPALTVCDRSVSVPRISDPAYLPTLMDLCAREHMDALIPTIDTDLLPLARAREDFERIGTHVLIAAPEKVALCRDKRYTADYFTSIGLHSPQPVDDVCRYTAGFPAFIKPKDGSSSIGAHKANDAEELAGFARQVPDYIIQPFVSGTEYTVDAFCDLNGEPVYITPRIRRAVRAGEVLKTEICQDPVILSEMQRLLADFHPRGAITVQLIRDERTGVDWYIEINPRYGGGAPLSMKAGADSAEMLLRLLRGETVKYQAFAAADGAVYSRFDQSVCVCRGHASRAPRAVIFDLDDTLYPEKDYVRSGFAAAAEWMPEVEHAAEKLWSAFVIGKPAIDTVLRDAGLYTKNRRDLCLAAYRDHTPTLSLYPGAEVLLRSLRERGVRLAILTDGRPEGQYSKIAALGLESLVDDVLITDTLGGPRFRKPNDLAFRVLQRRLDVPFSDMLYVGDNAAKDFQAPKALGMRWLHFADPNGLYACSGEEMPGAVHSFAQLTERLIEECHENLTCSQ